MPAADAALQLTGPAFGALGAIGGIAGDTSLPLAGPGLDGLGAGQNGAALAGRPGAVTGMAEAGVSAAAALAGVLPGPGLVADAAAQIAGAAGAGLGGPGLGAWADAAVLGNTAGLVAAALTGAGHGPTLDLGEVVLVTAGPSPGAAGTLAGVGGSAASTTDSPAAAGWGIADLVFGAAGIQTSAPILLALGGSDTTGEGNSQTLAGPDLGAQAPTHAHGTAALTATAGVAALSGGTGSGGEAALPAAAGILQASGTLTSLGAAGTGTDTPAIAALADAAAQGAVAAQGAAAALAGAGLVEMPAVAALTPAGPFLSSLGQVTPPDWYLVARDRPAWVLILREA